MNCFKWHAAGLNSMLHSMLTGAPLVVNKKYVLFVGQQSAEPDLQIWEQAAPGHKQACSLP